MPRVRRRTRRVPRVSGLVNLGLAPVGVIRLRHRCLNGSNKGDVRTADVRNEFPSPHEPSQPEGETLPHLKEAVVHHSKLDRPTSGLGHFPALPPRNSGDCFTSISGHWSLDVGCGPNGLALMVECLC